MDEGDAEKPGSLISAASTYAVLKIHIVCVRAPKGKNRETDGAA